MATCYFCDAPSTSREHVPPKCLFPKKEGNDGIDYRSNLSTVPSCDEHNQAKTHDDEYLRNILVMPITSNDPAGALFSKTTMKAAEKYPKLLRSITSENQPVIVQKAEGEQPFKTFAIGIDRERVDQALSMIGYGLYFLEYGTRYAGSVEAYPLFLGDLSHNGHELNVATNKIRQVCDVTFKQLPKKGASPDIFFYQAYFEASGLGIMHLCFYGGSRVCCLFKE
jgi:hypothetical protein